MSVCRMAQASRPRLRLAGLSWRRPLNAACRIIAVAGQAGELDLGDQLRLQPMHVRAFLRGASLPPNGLLSDAAALSAGMMRRTLSCAETGADDADDRPDDRRDRRRPSASGICRRWSSSRRCTTSCPARHLVLVQLSIGPSDRARRASWRRCLPAPSCRRIAGRRRRRSRNARHSGSAACSPLRASSSFFSRALRSRERQAAKILATGEQQIEGEKDQVRWSAFGQRRLQRAKSPARR